MSDRSKAIDHDKAEPDPRATSTSPASAADSVRVADSENRPTSSAEHRQDGARTQPDDEFPTESTNGSPNGSTSESTTGPTLSEQRRVRLQLVVVSAIVAIGLFIVFRGIMAGITGDERARYPDAIESVSPVPEAVQAFGSESIEVDLVTGYIGEITIDGIPIDTVKIGDYVPADVQPGAQIELPPVSIYEPGNATLVFTPSASAPIDRFAVGQHRVDLVYWSLVDGPERPRTYSWTFTVK